MTDDTSQPAATYTYRSYLLRLWREGDHDEAWRATLQSVTVPDERLSFPDLDGLIAYLLTACEYG